MEALISHTGGELDSLLKEWVWDTERWRYEWFPQRLFDADTNTI
jgi:hypothetical protein